MLINTTAIFTKGVKLEVFGNKSCTKLNSSVFSFFCISFKKKTFSNHDPNAKPLSVNVLHLNSLV